MSFRSASFIISFLFFISAKSFAQYNAVDSLLKELKNATHDSTRCNILNELAEKASDEEWPKYNQQLRSLCESKLRTTPSGNPLHRFYTDHLAETMINNGFLYEMQGEPDKARLLYQNALTLYEEIKHSEGIAAALNNIAGIYSDQGDIPMALDYYHKSLKIKEENELNGETFDKKGLALSINNIGVIYGMQGQLEKALEYYNRSLKIQEVIKDKRGIALTLNNIGLVYQHNGDIAGAMNYYVKSYKNNEEVGDKKGMGLSLYNIATLYKNQDDLTKASDYYQKCLKLFEEVKNKEGITNTLNYLAFIDLKNGNLKEAKAKAEKSFSLAMELGFPDDIREASSSLSRVHAQTGNWKEAYQMQVLFKQMSDSIDNEKNRKASIQKGFQYAYEKKHATDSLKSVEERKVFNAKIENEKTQRTALYIGIAMITLFSIFMYNRFRITRRQKNIIEEQKIEVELQRTLADERRILAEEQKHIIEEKQKEILDSIKYAKRIQKALITSEKYIERKLSDLNKNS